MRVRLLLLASTGLPLLLACALGCAGAKPAAAPEAQAPPSAAAPSAEVAALRLVYAGIWRSPACGLRNHEQVIALRSDGSFHLEDRISPCPEGAVCIWSGVETMDGRWQLDGDAIDLAPDAATPAIARPPTQLRWQPAPAGVAAPAGALEDQRGCLFVREVPKPPEAPPQTPAATPTPQTPAPEPSATTPAPSPTQAPVEVPTEPTGQAPEGGASPAPTPDAGPPAGDVEGSAPVAPKPAPNPAPAPPPTPAPATTP